MKKILLLVLILTQLIYARYSTYSTKKVQEELKKGTVVIDIRTYSEWKQYGTIRGSHKLTFFDDRGKFDLDTWMKGFKKLVKNKDQKFILVCAHGNRTRTVGQYLSDKMGYKKVYDLKGGINYGWIDKGLKTRVTF